ncbi:hypothetical protein [Clostridium tyrobutyricum]|jgi:hypothetical protein|uniref:hypothetical protein n=1 Tax=Clostridium tyrobutyricum TaxID=1519 RepID=UPI0018C66586|nr:hypothetical protein [Clostridium tyrobutyricum]MCH4198838.1 hypothetical protein [Clostridium tyrobutyricum]
MEELIMKNERNLKEKVYEDVINKKEIFASEEDEVVLNCEGQPCNFSYNKDL